MQVQRFEHDRHPFAQPHGTTRSATEQSGERTISSSSTRIDQPRTTSEADAPLSALKERLRGVSKVRSDVVAAAREKVAQGLFDTRASIEKLAASELRHNYF